MIVVKANHRCNDHGDAGDPTALTPDTKRVLHGVEAQLLFVFCRSYTRGRLPHINDRMIWKLTVSDYQDSSCSCSLSLHKVDKHIISALRASALTLMFSPLITENSYRNWIFYSVAKHISIKMNTYMWVLALISCRPFPLIVILTSSPHFSWRLLTTNLEV